MEEEALSLKIIIAKLLCWSLVGFDILLGGGSLFAPETVMKLFRPSAEPEGTPLLRRAASIWLFFVPVQVWAAIRTENPTALRSVAILRLQEVPADPLWLASGEGFGFFGKFGLVFAPIFNLVAGTYLWFSPFLNTAPSDSTSVSPDTIAGLLSKISPYTYGIRTFSATGIGQTIVSQARSNNLLVAAGCDLSTDPAYNEKEVQALVALCGTGQVDIAVVGEEALYFNYVSEQQLVNYIQRVKATGVTTTTSDTWGELIGHPAVTAGCDVVLANMFPYWEGQDIKVAIPYLDFCYNKVRQANLFKQIMVETGWPSAGETKDAAVASQDNATRFLSGFTSWAAAHNVKYYYFEAFDEPWKATHEGQVGAHWGIWDNAGVMKPGMAQVVGTR